MHYCKSKSCSLLLRCIERQKNLVFNPLRYSMPCIRYSNLCISASLCISEPQLAAILHRISGILNQVCECLSQKYLIARYENRLVNIQKNLNTAANTCDA